MQFIFIIILLRQSENPKRFGRSHFHNEKKNVKNEKNRMFCEMIVFESKQMMKVFSFIFFFFVKFC